MKKFKTLFCLVLCFLFVACNGGVQEPERTLVYTDKPIFVYDQQQGLIELQTLKGVEPNSGNTGNLYYTTDGTVPKFSSEIYRSPFEIPSGCDVLKVIWHINAGVCEYVSPVIEINVSDISGELPDVPSIVDTRISVDSWTAAFNKVEGERIFYTLDGSDPRNPSLARMEYDSPVIIGINDEIKAVSNVNGLFSELLVKEHAIAAPVVDVAGNGSTSISISVTSEIDSTVYYTNDGSDPVSSNTRKTYTGKLDVATSDVYRFVAYSAGKYSDVVEAAVSTVSMPAFSIERINDNTKQVTLSCNGADSIRYTTDGSRPDASSDEYVSPLSFDSNTVVRAVSVFGDLISAPVEMKVVMTVDKPTVKVSPVVDGVQTVSVVVADDAEVYYTIDGSDPDVEGSSRIAYVKPIEIRNGDVLRFVQKVTDVYSDIVEVKCVAPVVYKVGEIGPAGGMIVYDCDADNDSYYSNDGLKSSECGWRYLEMLNDPIGYEDGKLGISFYSNYIFGLPESSAIVVTFNDLGKGLVNTENHLASMLLSEKSGYDYAARLCSILNVERNGKVYDDWFLPSMNELNEAGVHSHYYRYWTSSNGSDSEYALCTSNWNNGFVSESKLGALGVYAFRAFSPDAVETPSIRVIEDNEALDSRTVEISTRTLGADIYYTMDGSDPRVNGIPYTGEFNVEGTALVKAYASLDGFVDSLDAFLIVGGLKTLPVPEVRQFIENNTVKLEFNSHAGARYYYTTDGTDPDHDSQHCDGKLVIDGFDKVKVFAVLEGYNDSPVFEYKVSEFTVGCVGPEGGIVFYDCDADNLKGDADGLRSDECGWRYLEAAPSKLKMKDGVLTVSPEVVDGISAFSFGFCSDENGNHVHAGNTSRTIGSGMSNTASLIESMENQNDSCYASLFCNILEGDWFLPSLDEFNKLKKYIDIEAEETFWTSSADEDGSNPENCAFNSDGIATDRAEKLSVWPVRAFGDSEQLAMPTVSVIDGVKVTLDCVTVGAEIHYTTDGTDPESSSTSSVYSGEITVSSPAVLKVCSSKDGRFSPVVAEMIGGAPINNLKIMLEKDYSYYIGKITCDVPDVIIRYTLNGSDPDMNSTLYDGTPIYNISPGSLIKIIAYRAGMIPRIKVVDMNEKYIAGMPGPAGGTIIYDCDEDNEWGNADGLKSSECGWRYMESAGKAYTWGGSPRVGNRGSKYDYYVYPFGYYGNGSSNNLEIAGTSAAIGKGLENTAKLIDAMKQDNAYVVGDGQEYVNSSAYAARMITLATRKTGENTVYDDWFIPSADELMLIADSYSRLPDSVWSSTEDPDDPAKAFSLECGKLVSSPRSEMKEVWPVRVFSEELEAPSIIYEKRPASGSQEVSIACTTTGAEIRYTIDGSDPFTSGSVYASPFTVNEATTVRAVAVLDGKRSCEDIVLVGGERKLDLLRFTTKLEKPERHSWKWDGVIVTFIPEVPGADIYLGRENNMDGKWTCEKLNSQTYPSVTIPYGNTIAHYYTECDGFIRSDETFYHVGYCSVGDVGPCGGLIIYDVDADNGYGNPDGLTSGGQEGRRYLEVMDHELRDCLDIGWSTDHTNSSYGFYFRRAYEFGDYLFNNNGTFPEKVTEDASFGSGYTNTLKLREKINGVWDDPDYEKSYVAVRSVGYYWSVNTLLKDNYSSADAKVNDWFIPSMDELKFMEECGVLKSWYELPATGNSKRLPIFTSTQGPRVNGVWVWYDGKFKESPTNGEGLIYPCRWVVNDERYWPIWN